MATRAQIIRLAQRIEALGQSNDRPCLIVIDPAETKEQAIARYAEERGAMPRGPITFIITGVPRKDRLRLAQSGRV